jgi:hypothetical protein
MTALRLIIPAFENDQVDKPYRMSEECHAVSLHKLKLHLYHHLGTKNKLQNQSFHLSICKASAAIDKEKLCLPLLAKFLSPSFSLLC